MVTNTVVIAVDSAEDKENIVPTFAPSLAASSVVTATRGRQNFNDSDKSNYFEV
ncbi:hypothetical protein ACIP93_33205 [Streptomyces sp. NPDC088745]|uniref:hypothetical protein n=1 Tax=Streptomyces sp. NPDC088745 TaxID=3365884 RepID=UPI0038160528